MVRSLAERLLHETPDAELRGLLEAASVVRQFDERLLGAVAGLDRAGPAFDAADG